LKVLKNGWSQNQFFCSLKTERRRSFKRVIFTEAKKRRKNMKEIYPAEKVEKWKRRAQVAALKTKETRMSGGLSVKRRERKEEAIPEVDKCYFCGAW